MGSRHPAGPTFEGWTLLAVLREYHGYGLPLVSPDDGITRLAETCAIVRRMWTDELVDFEGRHFQLAAPYPPNVAAWLADEIIR